MHTRLHLSTTCDCPATTDIVSVHNSVYEYSATVNVTEMLQKSPTFLGVHFCEDITLHYIHYITLH